MNVLYMEFSNGLRLCICTAPFWWMSWDEIVVARKIVSSLSNPKEAGTVRSNANPHCREARQDQDRQGCVLKGKPAG